jgi:hypothetical protein
MSPECHEIKGVDGELWLRVKLEQADIHASIKPVYRVISNCDKDAQTARKEMPRVTSLPTPTIVEPRL